MDRENSINLLAAILADLPQLSIYLRATTNRPSWAVANAAAPLTRSSWSAYGPTSTLTVPATSTTPVSTAVECCRPTSRAHERSWR
jgi:hypothetical protein